MDTSTGDVAIRGSLTKGGGGFKIDHPLHPAEKYLSHSFVESPEMVNIYNGNVVTDDKGEATVVLPAFFEALNRDYCYQLTPVGDMAQAAVTRPVWDNSFAIRTDKPGVTVSWQVTGVRQDHWANAHRIIVEEAKPEGEQNRYLHPEPSGQCGGSRSRSRPEGRADARRRRPCPHLMTCGPGSPNSNRSTSGARSSCGPCSGRRGNCGKP